MIAGTMRTMKTQGERLSEAVFAAGYAGAADFARALGRKEGDTTVRSHMNGSRNFREATARIYAAKLGVSWMWLMYGEGDQLAAPSPVPEASRDSDAYMEAVKWVRMVFSAADIKDRDLETKAIAELYHSLKTGRKG
jgi:hypothetical protein